MKPRFQKLLALFLIVMLTTTLLFSCANVPTTETKNGAESSTEVQETIDTDLPIRISVLSGSTGYGAVKLINDSKNGKTDLNYQISIEASVKIIQDSLISGEVDIAALPTNKASLIYHSTNGAIQVIAVNTLGVLSLVTTNGETIASIQELRGKTISIPEEPSYILRALCEKAGLIDGEDITIETYATPSDLVTAVIRGSVTYAVLPEPLLSTVMSKKDTVQIALDLSKEWEAVFDGAELMQGCLVVRTAWAKEHPLELARFMQEYEASLHDVNADPASSASMIEIYFGTAAAVAEKAIPHCNLVYIAGTELETRLGNFYQFIKQMPGVNMGDSLPGSDFYYKP